MLIEVPDNLAKRILRNVEFDIQHEERRSKETSLLSTDDGLKAEIKAGAFSDFNGMVGRLNDYPDLCTPLSTVASGRRVFRDYLDQLGGLCPVVMRGSRWNLHRKYAKGGRGSHPNGWNERVADRYLRMIKHTSIGWDKEREKQYQIIQDWAGHTWGKFNNPLKVGANIAFIQGKSVWINDFDTLQAVKSLLRHIDKINYIDKCVARIEGRL
jgi:hypothetical protein